MKFKLVTILILTLFVTLAKSQAPINALKIGEKCPNFQINGVINHPQKNVMLSDFKGKWLILDFWFVNCPPCVAMLPKCEKLQEKFKDKIQFLPVTRDNEEQVKGLFSKMNEGKGVNYLTAINNGAASEVRQLFPHTTEPFYVWIDPQGIVRAFTGYDDMTEENIVVMLTKPDAKLTIATDQQYDDSLLPGWSTNEPFLVKTKNKNDAPGLNDYNRSQLKIKFQSVVTNYLPLNRFSIGFNYFANPHYFAASNQSIAQLFQYAYARSSDESYIYPWCRTLIEMGDSTYIVSKITKANDYFYPLSGSQSQRDIWRIKNTFCYNLWIDTSIMVSRQQALKYMQEDLSKVFPIKASYERRRLKSIVLITSNPSLLKTSHNKYRYEQKFGFSLTLENATIDEFLKPFHSLFLRSPVINETNFKGRFDIDISTDMYDLKKVNEKLGPYGLKFIEADREVEVLVLKEVLNQFDSK